MTLSFRYVGSRFNTTGDQQPLPPFDVFALAITYQVNQYFQAYTRVDNLFNEEVPRSLELWCASALNLFRDPSEFRGTFTLNRNQCPILGFSLPALIVGSEKPR